jgi:hypothetical protein
MLNIFVNTWGNYNENGADVGEWITLPMNPDELQNKLQAIAAAMNDNDPEFFINDYEFTCEIEFGDVGEMDSITEWNDLCNDVEGLKEYELEEIAAAMEAFGYNFAEAMERQQNGEFIFYSGMDLEEVAHDLVQECYFTKDTPEIFERYFDYAAFARDLGFDGYTETKYGVILEG